jgi:hypothetical protein
VSVARFYTRPPVSQREAQHAKHERLAAIRRAAMKASALPARQPVTAPVVRRRKSSVR